MAFYPTTPPVVSGQFQIYADGLDLGHCNKATVPLGKVKITKTNSAGNPYETKFPSGMGEFDGLKLEMFHAASGATIRWLLAWRDQCANFRTGQTGTTPDAAKKVITVEERDGGGNVVFTWKCVGAIPENLGELEHEAGKEDAVMLKLEFSVDRVDLE